LEKKCFSNFFLLPIQFREVQVMVGGQNKALVSAGATSIQSSTNSTNTSDKARDGSTATFSLTADSSPWWSVNLQTAGYIHAITLMIDGTGCNLDGAVMTLSDSSNNKVATRTLSGCGTNGNGVMNLYFSPACTCK
jgi:hypothetical protein